MVRFRGGRGAGGREGKPSWGGGGTASSVTDPIDFFALFFSRFEVDYLSVDHLLPPPFFVKCQFQSSCSIIPSLMSPKALSCTFSRRGGSTVFLWPV